MKFRTIVIATLAVVAGFLAIPVFVLLVGVYENTVRYDRENDDYKYVKSVLNSASSPHSLNLGKINDGNWRFICVVGAYSKPEKILRDEAGRRRIDIAEIDAVKTQFLGVAPVEENESAISFVDSSGRGQTLLIDGFESLIQQGGRECFGPETREIAVPRPRNLNVNI